MTDRNGIAFVFPGQGSQHVGMGRALCDRFPEAGAVFEEAEDALGANLREVCFDGPEADLNRTENTQPAILAVSVAALRVLQGHGAPEPAWVAGHSLGEYSALVAAGALGLADAVKVVRERGRLMQQAVAEGEGSMAAILGLEEAAVRAVCDAAGQGEVVAPANLNGGGQVVISGAREAVRRAVQLARDGGARKVVELAVSAPFHCALMRPAAEGLRKTLESVEVGPFRVGVVTNVEASLNSDPERVKPLLVEQVVAAVRWEESMKALAGLGCQRVIELGPGRVLSGLARRIDRGMSTFNLEKPEDLDKLLPELGV
ncbi:MAG: ACP S-malonyltransferase [Deltaproteobacteria bacterium]|nr:ACP S-malonyltransferase [Deltaproteobacteria bacterium]